LGRGALWLHNFSADTIVGLGGEHQTIGDARWNFGRLSFNHGFGAAENRSNLYGEVAEGTGHDRIHDYDYSIVTVGLFQNFTRQLSVQFEDKQINVDTAQGNLPKLAVGYLWTPRLSTTLGYAYSVSGSLDTRLAMARIDGYTRTMNFFAGLANGQAAPIVNNLPADIAIPGFILHEYYVGAGRTFSRADITTVLDYVRLGTSNHWTLTFNATLHEPTGGAKMIGAILKRSGTWLPTVLVLVVVLLAGSRLVMLSLERHADNDRAAASAALTQARASLDRSCGTSQTARRIPGRTPGARYAGDRGRDRKRMDARGFGQRYRQHRNHPARQSVGRRGSGARQRCHRLERTGAAHVARGNRAPGRRGL